jgi:hypothetical protein
VATQLTPELSEFIGSGVSILVGTRDAELKPACLRASGAKANAERSEVVLYLGAAVALRTLDNLRNNGEIAATFSRAIDHRALQLKGHCVGIRSSESADKALQERYEDEYGKVLLYLGLPKQVVARRRFWPSVAVTFKVEGIFEQTPGPRAGLPFKG